MLKFYYGVMASGKSATLLMSAYQKEKDGNSVLLLKPYDQRDEYKICSRVGLSKECVVFDNNTNMIHLIAGIGQVYKHIYIDECQFLTNEQVLQLWKLSNAGIDISCFGLKTTFKNELFDSIKTLIVHADETKTIQPPCNCKYCDNIANTHLLFVNDEVALDVPEKFEGDVEGTTRFECVCQSCWYEKTEKLK